MSAGSTSAGGGRRILIVGPVPPPMQGVTVMTSVFLDTMRSAGWSVSHVDTSDHRAIDNIGRFDAANVALALRHLADFAVTLLRRDVDIVYLPLSQGLAGFLRDAAFLVVARMRRRAVVVHAHGGQYQEFYRRMPPPVRRLMRLALADVRLILVLAEAQRRQFDGWAPPGVLVDVVPNGVADEWRSGLPSRRRRSGLTVLYLGNLKPQKGFLDVLDAVPEVLRRSDPARFVFAGRQAWHSGTAAQVDDRLRDPVVRGAVTLLGAVGVAERHRLLQEADIVVFPPRWNEGQPLVALEALSAGLPLVVTASGGLAETVRDGVEGLVVPKQDPRGLAEAIVRLLGDEELRLAMGSAARARFEAAYTLERWGSRMTGALESAYGVVRRG